MLLAVGREEREESNKAVNWSVAWCGGKATMELLLGRRGMMEVDWW